MEYNVCVESLFSLGVVLLGLNDRCCSLTFSVALKRCIKMINYRVVYSSIAENLACYNNIDSIYVEELKIKLPQHV
jgi:hypothetical protein